jgi:hypothetical protein
MNFSSCIAEDKFVFDFFLRFIGFSLGETVRLKRVAKRWYSLVSSAVEYLAPSLVQSRDKVNIGLSKVKVVKWRVQMGFPPRDISHDLNNGNHFFPSIANSHFSLIDQNQGDYYYCGKLERQGSLFHCTYNKRFTCFSPKAKGLLLFYLLDDFKLVIVYENLLYFVPATKDLSGMWNCKTHIWEDENARKIPCQKIDLPRGLVLGPETLAVSNSMLFICDQQLGILNLMTKERY